MRRVLSYSIFLLLGGLLLSCKPSQICPAYHSSFIHDTEVIRSTFSLFGPDSLPKDPETELWVVEKQKVGIADDYRYKKKNDKMAIIKMEDINVKKFDPLDMPLAMAEMDSSMVDSLRQQRMSDQYKDFYNYDQMIYLHYFGDYLPKGQSSGDITDDLKKDESLISDDLPTEEGKEKKGFLKGLFKKKEKTSPDDQEEELMEDEPEEDQ